jgi:hypothetical protein
VHRVLITHDWLAFRISAFALRAHAAGIAP